MIQEFDIVVVGSGVGGCSVASRACEHGLKVLMLDKGSELQSNSVNEINMSFVVDGVTSLIKIPSIHGPGGNSLIYGGHLTRYPEHYWAESSESHIPVDYKKISIYYEEILKKFNISPNAYSKSEVKVKKSFEKSGFGSEEIIWAISNHPACNGCGGVYCPKNCKKDFFSVLCAPLVSQRKLMYWSDTSIKDISIGESNQYAIKIQKQSKEISLSAKFIVFSCGTLGTPAEIVRLFGNRLDGKVIDLFGRGIMFHVSDFFIIFPKFLILKKLRAKLFCSSENLIELEGQKVRYSIQSVGAELSGSTIYRYINRRYEHVLNKVFFSKKLLWILSHLLAIPLSRSHIIASIVEDPSLFENRLAYGNSPIQVNYRFEPKFSKAIHEINKKIIKNLKSKFFIIKFGGDLNLNYGHAMGGMSMGMGRRFPVDENCKVKSLDNIYVCDASILPHSAATNPSLTIAALAYHAADGILNLLKKSP